MQNLEALKAARNVMLRLHKALIDHEKRIYESLNGPINPGRFLGLLLESQDLAWLRRFSMLIVEIDEMLELDDGYSTEMIDAYIEKARGLVEMTDVDEDFRVRYQAAIQRDMEAAALHAELRRMLK